jgi:hypothetical protein
MPTYELKLTSFKFPKTLENHKANFRFVVDLRYIDIEGNLATAQAILPGLDTFWECDKGRSNQSNYVRGPEEGSWATFDMNRIDSWDRLIFMVPASSLHSIQFKIFDVNRTDGWDKIKTTLSSISGAIFEDLKKFIPGLFGSATDDIKSFLLKKWAGGDTILYKLSMDFIKDVAGLQKITGACEIQFLIQQKSLSG